MEEAKERRGERSSKLEAVQMTRGFCSNEDYNLEGLGRTRVFPLALISG